MLNALRHDRKKLEMGCIEIGFRFIYSFYDEFTDNFVETVAEVISLRGVGEITIKFLHTSTPSIALETDIDCIFERGYQLTENEKILYG